MIEVLLNVMPRTYAGMYERSHELYLATDCPKSKATRPQLRSQPFLLARIAFVREDVRPASPSSPAAHPVQGGSKGEPAYLHACNGKGPGLQKNFRDGHIDFRNS